MVGEVTRPWIDCSYHFLFLETQLSQLVSNTSWKVWLRLKAPIYVKSRMSQNVRSCAFVVIWRGHKYVCLYNNLTHPGIQVFIAMFHFAIYRFIYYNEGNVMIDAPDTASCVEDTYRVISWCPLTTHAHYWQQSGFSDMTRGLVVLMGGYCTF